jgi:hypothetical protein
MWRLHFFIYHLGALIYTLSTVVCDAVRFLMLCFRPALPKDLQVHIRRMALGNPTWGQERIANELLLKLGLKVSPRTVLSGLHHEYELQPQAA